MIGLVNLLYKSKELLEPYFENENKIRNRLLLLAYLGSNLVQAVVVMFLFSYMSVFLGMFSMPTVTYQLFFNTLMDFTGTLLVYGAGQACKFLATTKLKMSLIDSLANDLNQRWLDPQKDAYFGIHLQHKKLYPNKVLRDDVKDTVDMSMEILDISISTFFGFFIGIYRLCSMSAMLAFQFMGREIAVPGLMALGSVLYALGYNAVSSYISRPLDKLISDYKRDDAHQQKIIHHIDSHPEAIALQGTAVKERHFYANGTEKLNETREEKLKVSTGLKFIDKVHQYLSVAVGLIMAAPSIIAQKVQATDVLEINHYFSDIISFFTAYQENINTVTKLNTSIDRISDFQKALKEWEKVKQDHTTTHYNQGTFKLSKFSVTTPDGRVLLKNATTTIPQGKITLLAGETGTGKSTLIKAMAGIWPYTKGRCALPESKAQTQIIPQKPCLPFQSTLLEAITYPLSDDQVAKVKPQSVVAMMKQLGLDIYAQEILHPTEAKSWSEELSGGELQRIALIGAALKQPKLLILDESLSALDADTKQLALAFIKKHLKKATILVIDHQPNQGRSQTPYYQHQLTLKSQKITAAPAPRRMALSM